MQSGLIAFLTIMMCLTVRKMNRLGHLSQPTMIHYRSMPEEPQAICGCKHHQCFHDETSCGATVSDPDGFPVRDGKCGCKRYTGPDQLPTVIP
jgi:hypothetical protein